MTYACTTLTRPYRKPDVGQIAAGVQLGLVFVYAAACFLKVHQTITEVFGSTGTEAEVDAKVSRIMSLASDDFAYLLLVCCVLLTSLCGAWAGEPPSTRGPPPAPSPSPWPWPFPRHRGRRQRPSQDPTAACFRAPRAREIRSGR